MERAGGGATMDRAEMAKGNNEISKVDIVRHRRACMAKEKKGGARGEVRLQGVVPARV